MPLIPLTKSGAILLSCTLRVLPAIVLPRDNANAAQVRREIGHLAAEEQDLLMQGGNESGKLDAHLLGDGLKPLPENPLQPDARALSVQSKRPRFKRLTVRILACEKMAHFLDPTIVLLP
jgi:hypothetical protein